MPPGKEKGLMGAAGGDTQVNPSGLVGNETSAATVQTVAPFVERDEGFDGKSPTDHATVGGRGWSRRCVCRGVEGRAGYRERRATGPRCGKRTRSRRMRIGRKI